MPSTLHQIAVVFRKELKDSLRDGRALFSIAFTVIMGPVLIGFMMNRVADRQREAEQVQVPVAGQEHAPALVDWLLQESWRYRAAALLMTTVVLITQNRQAKLSERHMHLDLQVNLLTEQKTAKLIELLEELRRDLPNVRDRRDAEAEVMQRAAEPLRVIAALEEQTVEAAREAIAEGQDDARDER